MKEGNVRLQVPSSTIDLQSAEHVCRLFLLRAHAITKSQPLETSNLSPGGTPFDDVL